MSCNAIKTTAGKLSLIIAGALSTLPIASFSNAEPIELELFCPIPLIGKLPVSAHFDIAPSSDMIGNYDLNTELVFPNDLELALGLVGASYITGLVTTSLTYDGVPVDVSGKLEPTDSDCIAVDGKYVVKSQLPPIVNAEVPSFNVDGIQMQLQTDGPLPFDSFDSVCSIAEQSAQSEALSASAAADTHGVSSSPVSLSPYSVIFEETLVGTPIVQDFELTNNSDSPIMVKEIQTGPNFNNTITQTNNCSEPLSSGSSCTITINILSDQQQGVFAFIDVIFEDDQQHEDIVTSSIEGVIVNEYSTIMDLSPRVLNFGKIQVGETVTKQVTVTNVGKGSAQLEQVNISAPNNEYSAEHSCGLIGPNESCVLSVTYTPSSESDTSCGLPGSLYLTISGENYFVALYGQASSVIIEPPLAWLFSGNATLGKSEAPIELIGSAPLKIQLASGEIEGSIDFEPAAFSMPVLFPGLNATAKLNFVNGLDANGMLIANKLELNATSIVRLTELKVDFFGLFTIPMNTGDLCQTTAPTNMALSTPDNELVDLANTSRLEGTLSLPSFENCGSLTSIITNQLSGSNSPVEMAFHLPGQP